MVGDNRQSAISSKMKLAGRELHRLSKPDLYLLKQSKLYQAQRRQAAAALREMRKKLRLLLHRKSTQLTRSAILLLRRLIRFMEKLYPIARGIAAGAVMLGIVYTTAGCSGGGGGGGSGGTDTTPTDETLTLAQRIEKVQTEALAKGCTVVDTNTGYSILQGGENDYGSNYVSRQGNQTGTLETVAGSITINCNGQNFNFVFADDTTQSDKVQKANAEPVGDINEFFKSDKKTEADIEAFIAGKFDLTALCRFAMYSDLTGNIDESSTETLSVGISGKDCETPQWFINGSVSPAGTGNTLKVGSSNLSSGGNDIIVKVTNPAGTNSLYLTRTRGNFVNNPATAIDVSITPTDVYASTPGITGSEVVTDADGNTSIVRKWYKNGALVSSGATSYTGGQSGGDVITYEATADGAVTDTASVTVKYSSCTIQFTSCYPSICAIPAFYDETHNMTLYQTIDAIVDSVDKVVPTVSGDIPAGITATPSTNRVSYTGTIASGAGGSNLTLKPYTSTVTTPSCSGSVTINVRGPPPEGI